MSYHNIYVYIFIYIYINTCVYLYIFFNYFYAQKQCFIAQLVIIYNPSGEAERFNSFKIYCASWAYKKCICGSGSYIMNHVL